MRHATFARRLRFAVTGLILTSSSLASAADIRANMWPGRPVLIEAPNFNSILNLPSFTAGHSVNLPPVNTKLTQDFSVTLSGEGTQKISNINIQSNWGSIGFNGQTLEALAYQQIPWGGFGLNLYQIVARQGTGIFTAWIYCNDAAQMTDIYYESSSSPQVSYEIANGSCYANQASTAVTATWPMMALKTPTPVRGFTITGAGISLASGGIGKLGEKLFSPYAVVDCTQDCGSPGWYELHSIVYDPITTQSCYAIFYLFTGASSPIELARSICFPELDGSIDETFTGASWQKN